MGGDEDSYLSSDESNITTPRQPQTRIGIRHVLAHPTGFEEFVHHCIYEFRSSISLSLSLSPLFVVPSIEEQKLRKHSVENVLSVYEMAQFRKKYKTSSSRKLILRLPEGDDFPNSDIVYDESLGIEEKVILLIEKYVRQGSEFQVETPSLPQPCLFLIWARFRCFHPPPIPSLSSATCSSAPPPSPIAYQCIFTRAQVNISSEVRKNLEKVYHRLKNGEREEDMVEEFILPNIFDEMCKKTVNLMYDSFMRFENAKGWDKLEGLLRKDFVGQEIDMKSF